MFFFGYLVGINFRNRSLPKVSEEFIFAIAISTSKLRELYLAVALKNIFVALGMISVKINTF